MAFKIRTLATVSAMVGFGLTACSRNQDAQPVAAVAPAAPMYAAPGDSSAPPPASADGYYPSHLRPVYVRQPDVVPQDVAQPEPVQQPLRAGRVREQEYYTDSRGHRRGRTKTHSVEIVAGTAAVGAAIGAIAGGGKGAAIGAVSGGGAGFAYDRLTHNHR